MENFGAGKDAVIIQDVVPVHVLMSGIMHRQFLIFFPNLNVHSGKLNSYPVRIRKGIRLSGLHCRYGLLQLLFMQHPTASSAE